MCTKLKGFTIHKESSINHWGGVVRIFFFFFFFFDSLFFICTMPPSWVMIEPKQCSYIREVTLTAGGGG